MAKCKYCNKEMIDGHSCDLTKIVINGKTYDRLTTGFFEDLGDPDLKCHDCGIHNDGKSFHHYGCDMERCPACGGQMISCDCDKETLIQYFFD